MNYELQWLEIHHLCFYVKIKKPSKCFNERFSSNDTFTIVIISAGFCWFQISCSYIPNKVKCGQADMRITRVAVASKSDQLRSFNLSDDVVAVWFNNILY